MVLPSENNITTSRAIFLLNNYKIFIVMSVVFATPIAPVIMRLCKRKRGIDVVANMIYAIVVLGLFVLSMSMIVSGESNPFLYVGF